MHSNQRIFKFLGKPIIRWAAHQAIVGRNRSPFEPQKGRFTTAEVSHILDQSWLDFDTLLPDLSREPTVGARLNLRLAALTLAFYRNLTAAGIENQYAIELISDTCWKVYQWWGNFGQWMTRLSRSNVIEKYRRLVQPDGSLPLRFPFNPPGYRTRYVPIDNGLGFDVIRCPVAEYMRAQGASDLTINTWCMLDYALQDISRIRLMRTQTLAAGDNYCDFRLFPADKP